MAAVSGVTITVEQAEELRKHNHPTNDEAYLEWVYYPDAICLECLTCLEILIEFKLKGPHANTP